MSAHIHAPHVETQLSDAKARDNASEALTLTEKKTMEVVAKTLSNPLEVVSLVNELIKPMQMMEKQDALTSKIDSLSEKIDRELAKGEDLDYDKLELLIGQLLICLYRRDGRIDKEINLKSGEQLRVESAELKKNYNGTSELVFTCIFGGLQVIGGVMGIAGSAAGAGRVPLFGSGDQLKNVGNLFGTGGDVANRASGSLHGNLRQAGALDPQLDMEGERRAREAATENTRKSDGGKMEAMRRISEKNAERSRIVQLILSNR